MMARTIWKFPLTTSDVQEIDFPYISEILHVGVQNGQINIWASVYPTQKTAKRVFHIYGTGHTIPDNPGTYIGTAMLHDGRLVLHVYDFGFHFGDMS